MTKYWNLKKVMTSIKIWWHHIYNHIIMGFWPRNQHDVMWSFKDMVSCCFLQVIKSRLKSYLSFLVNMIVPAQYQIHLYNVLWSHRLTSQCFSFILKKKLFLKKRLSPLALFLQAWCHWGSSCGSEQSHIRSLQKRYASEYCCQRVQDIIIICSIFLWLAW